MDGQMSIFDYQPQMQEPEEELYWPCDLCDVIYGYERGRRWRH